MSADELDRDAMAKQLREFAGEQAGLESARTWKDFGCLAALPQVQADVPQRRDGSTDFEDWKKAVYEALQEAASSFTKPENLIDGTAKRTRVSSARLRRGIVLTFNLDREPDLGTAKARRDAAREAMGLQRGARLYREPGGSESELLVLLAQKLIEGAEDVKFVTTEFLGIAVMLQPVGSDNSAPQPAAALTDIVVRREIKVGVDGTSLMILPESEICGVDWGWWADGGYKVSEGNVRFETTKFETPRYSSRTLVRLPRLSRGRTFAFQYEAYCENMPPPVDVLDIQPLETYGKVRLRACFPDKVKPPTIIMAYKESREPASPYPLVWDHLVRVEPDADGNYTLEVENPTPHLHLGFMFWIDPLDPSLKPRFPGSKENGP